MATCILHIGSPKTGTTTIQGWLRRNRVQLADTGVLFPDGERRHNAIVSAFHKRPHKLAFNVRRDDLSVDGRDRDLLDKQLAEAKSSGAEITVFSNEMLLVHGNRLDLKAMRAHLDPFFDDFRVVCYVRDPYRHLISRTQEAVKSAGRSYSYACENTNVIDTRYLDLFAEAFGEGSLVLRNFDQVVKQPKGLLADFLEIVRPDLTEEGYATINAQNIGLSLEAGLIFGGMNESLPEERWWEERFIDSKTIRNIGHTKFNVPPENVLAKKDELMTQYAYLEGRGLEFTPPDWDNLPNPQPDWSEQTMREIGKVMNDLAREAKAARKVVQKAPEPTSRMTRVLGRFRG